MSLIFYSFFFVLYFRETEFAGNLKFSAETFSAISVLANEGKNHLDLLVGKTNVSRYGSCWKNAITDLQVGCKFLNENIQKDLALKLSDCFLQTSGSKPIKCEAPQNACFQKLSDREFNVYTEFFTHTHSICYFLQSQIWQEEAEKTVNKLSSTSAKVSKQLHKSERIQQSLLNHQKKSFFVQNDLLKLSEGITIALNSSQNTIYSILEDYKNSSLEQKQLLTDVFKNLLDFKSWAVNEITWFSSSVFFIGALITSFLFTSVSRLRDARVYIFIVFSLNFLFERFISSVEHNINNNKINLYTGSGTFYEWIWFVRKFCIFLSILIIFYIALSYCDYNKLNYKLLLEIKNQNVQILNHIYRNGKFNDLFNRKNSDLNWSDKHYVHSFQNYKLMHKINNKISNDFEEPKAYMHAESSKYKIKNNLFSAFNHQYDLDQVDDSKEDNDSFTLNNKRQSLKIDCLKLSPKKYNTSKNINKSPYNLRSHSVSKV